MNALEPNATNTNTTAVAAAYLGGRALLALLFVVSGVGKLVGYDKAATFMGSKGLPMVDLLLPATIAIELVCAAALLAGAWVRAAAVVLLLWMVPVTLVFHAFWAVESAQRQVQQTQFLKNVAIMGGLLVLAAGGAGAWSVDRRRRRPSKA